MLLRFTSFIFLLCSFSGFLTAQKAGYLDLVNLKNGQKLEGIITRYEPGDLLTIRLRNGKETTLTMNEVKRIGFTSLGKDPLEKPTAEVEVSILDKTGKFTSHVSIGANFSTERNDNNGFFQPTNSTIAGYSFSFVEAYNFSPSLRAGIGTSYLIFNPERKERVATFYGHARYLVSKKLVAPFVQLEAGYGLPIGSADIPLISRKGGVMVHPSLGFRVAAKPDQPELSFDLGYNFMTVQSEISTFQGLETRTNKYQRFMLRLGTTF